MKVNYTLQLERVSSPNIGAESILGCKPDANERTRRRCCKIDVDLSVKHRAMMVRGKVTVQWEVQSESGTNSENSIINH